MSGARLTAGLWVHAYRHRLGLAGIPVYVAAKGDPTAGAVLVKVARMNGEAQLYGRELTAAGRAWTLLRDGAEGEIDDAVTRQRGFDPDLWVLEIEDAAGRHLLDEPGLD
ncbi:MAG: DUF1491 family protein [Pseudomonadota bacterium]